MAKQTFKFKRGDATVKYFQIPEDSWSPGGTLYFAAKSKPDDDVTDAAAVIDKSFDDDAIVDSDHEMYLDGYVTYELAFAAGDIDNVSFSDGSKKKTFLGEFQYVPFEGEPDSFPSDDDFIDVTIFADIKRGA